MTFTPRDSSWECASWRSSSGHRRKISKTWRFARSAAASRTCAQAPPAPKPAEAPAAGLFDPEPEEEPEEIPEISVSITLPAAGELASDRMHDALMIDFGRELYVPWQLNEGKALYRDIAYFHGPFSPYLNI